MLIVLAVAGAVCFPMNGGHLRAEETPAPTADAQPEIAPTEAAAIATETAPEDVSATEIDSSSLTEEMPEPVIGFLQTYCLDCHGHDAPSGEVRLAAPLSAAEVQAQALRWNKALRVVRYHEMPPAEWEQPSEEERQVLLAWIDGTLERTVEQTAFDPGRPTLRRLNKIELQNTVADLLGVTENFTKDLPSDPTAYSFDNIGDVLFTSPVLLEKYLDAFRFVVDQTYAQPERKTRLLAVTPNDEITPLEAARQNLARFMPRAFRRPVSDDELAARLQLVSNALEQGRPFDDALRPAVESVLLSPHFIFRIEADQADESGTPSHEPYRISDAELATRLSYLIWSTMPDDELFAVAATGTLHQPEVLSAQVTRMLDDPRSRALSENFAAQWLRFREILGLGVDFRSYPKFNGALQRDFHRESVTFFDHLFRDNRSALEIIDSDYTYLNKRLAEHYGIADVNEGRDLQRVALADRRRGGVLGMGSILTVTSYPTRTSPVLRGKWVLEELLGSPPPPPPPDIPSLSQVRSKEGKELTQRQRLEIHRQDASCASCHQKMDPLGFALENYDGIGQWRDTDAEEPIDASGELAGGAKLDGPAELRDVLLDRQKLVMRTLIEKLFTYAVGRPPEAADEGVIRSVLDQAAQDDYRMRTILQGIVASQPFQYRRNLLEDPTHDSTLP